MRNRRIGMGTVCSTLALALGMTAGPLWASEASDKARELFKKGDLRGAVIVLKDALQNDPNDAESRLQLGKIDLRYGNGAAAEQEIEKAIQLGASPDLWRLDLVEALVQQGRFDEAMQRLQAAGELSGKDQARAQALRGIAALAQDKPDEARIHLQDAVKIDPDNQQAALGLIRLDLKENDRDAAIRGAETLLQRFPKSPEALLVRAELYRSAGANEEALKLLDRLVESDPQSIAGRLARATVEIALKDPDRARRDLDEIDKIQKNVPLVAYLRGVIDFQAKNWQAASEELERMLSMVPAHPESQLLLGIIRYSQGQNETAEELLGKALKAMPGNLEALKVLAAVRIKMHKPEQAIDLLEPYADKGDAQLLALLGSAYMVAGDLERGQEWLNKAVEVAPNQASLRTQLALSMLAGGQTDKAIGELQSAVDLGQDVLQADVLLVLAHLKNKQFDDALKASEALEKRRPDSPVSYNLTGLAYMAKGDSDSARQRFEKALAVDPEFVTADLNLARIDVARKDLDSAQKRYEDILKNDPKHLQALLGLAALADLRKDPEGVVKALERAQDANPKANQPGLLLARHYIGQGDYLKALTVANDLAGRFPNDQTVLEMLARAQTLGGQAENAIRTFDKLVQGHPERPNLWYLSGGAHWKNQDLKGAQDAFRRALRIAPDFVDAQLALASVSLEAGDTETAIGAAEALKLQFPKSAVGYRVEGAIYAKERDMAKAAESYAKAYAIEKSSQLARAYADALQQSGRSDEAVKVLAGWTNDNPGDTEAQAMLGLVYQQLGRSKEAIAVYQLVIDKEPQPDPMLLNNLAWLYQQQGDLRAEGLAKEAYGKLPNRPEVADTYGWILFNSGKKDEGLSILQQAYLASPTQTEIGYHVAVALEGVGRRDEAVQILRKVLRTDSSSPQAEEAKKLLKKLGG